MAILITILASLFISPFAMAGTSQLDMTYSASLRKAENDVQSESTSGAGVKIRYSYITNSSLGLYAHIHKDGVAGAAGFALVGKRWESGNFSYDLNAGVTWGSYAIGPAIAPAINYHFSGNLVVSLIIPCRFYDAPFARAQVAPYLGMVF